MQESNQRKSRKNNASPRKISTRTPLFFPPHAHGILFFDDLLATLLLFHIICISAHIAISLSSYRFTDK
jgi:hypothetical protein